MRQWLAGAALYVDIIEINPPWAMYLVLPAIWLADFLTISDTSAIYVFTAAVLFTSLAWVAHILNHDNSLSEPNRLVVLLLAALAVTVPAMANIAQREHLMVILALPYVFGFLVLPRPDSGFGGVARACFAAVGLMMKPHFILIPVALTLVEIVKLKSLRPVFAPSNLTFLLLGLLYVLLVARFHPAYFSDIVPLGIQVYGAYGYDGLTVLMGAKPIFIAAFAGLLLAGARKVKGAKSLAAVVLSVLFIYLAQWTGYAYQSLPITMFVALAAGWFVVQPQLKPTMRLFSLLLVFFINGYAINKGFYTNPWVGYLSQTLKGFDQPKRMMSLSTNLGEAFPYVLEANVGWTSRYPALWAIPGALNGLARLDCGDSAPECENLQAILAQSRRAIVDDLIAQQPNILLVMRKAAYVEDPDFEFITFLSVDPRFEPFLADFREIEQNEVFSLLLRAG